MYQSVPYAHYSLLLISSKFLYGVGGGGRGESSALMLLYCSGGVVGWASNATFLGPKWHWPIGSMAFHRAQKSLELRHNPLPLALVMDAARIKSITHGDVS
jgi:hypothetical protein